MNSTLFNENLNIIKHLLLFKDQNSVQKKMLRLSHLAFKKLTNKNYHQAFASKKLKYGQGGQLKLDLTQNNYHLQFETIWEDYCLVEFEENNEGIAIEEDADTGKAVISDQELACKNQGKIHISIKIPEDFTFYGSVNGSIQHTKSQVSNKLRCYNTEINMIGPKRIFQWGSLETPSISITNREGAIDIRTATFQNGLFNCNSFSSEKLLLSQKVVINALHNINCRSIVTYGNAEAFLKTCYLELDSISGKSQIEAEKIKIDRIWASPNGINIKTKSLQKIGIETGSGIVHSEQKLDMDRISLGRLHKGKIIQIDEHTIKIV